MIQVPANTLLQRDKRYDESGRMAWVNYVTFGSIPVGDRFYIPGDRRHTEHRLEKHKTSDEEYVDMNDKSTFVVDEHMKVLPWSYLK